MNTITLIPAPAPLNNESAFDRWEPHYECETKIVKIPGPAEYFMTYCPEHNVKGLILEPRGEND